MTTVVKGESEVKNVRLLDRVAIITGSGQGLGRAYALRFAAEGAKVVIADIDERTAEQVAREIQATGAQAVAVRTDVSKEQDTLDMAKLAVQHFGRIDVLVNNAALSLTLTRAPFFELSLAEWNQVLAVNVTGTFLCCRAVFPQMKAQGKGKIINVSSDTVLWGAAGYIHYITSKSAIIGLTRALAREVGESGICVNTLFPGLTVTDSSLGEHLSTAIAAALSEQCMKRSITPQDMAGAVMFLASDESDMVTGQSIVVNGGRAMP